jgi:MOSC domain-containing protein YiiM
MTGRLVGIARHGRPKGPMETVDHAHVGLATGIGGDFRGAMKPGRRNKRQVTLMQRGDWEAALADLGTDALSWEQRRANLLIEGVVLPRHKGARIRIGDAVVLEINGECDPCSRMETIAPGLCAALTPEWRGGRITTVVAEGEIRVGDIVAVEED